MQQRKLTGVGGRPDGTDGSDFSYRMLVDSRYTKVAKAKYRLYMLIIIQVIMQVLALLSLVLSVVKERTGAHDIACSVISAMSFLLGGLGLRRSAVTLLKFFIIASSTSAALSMASLASRNVLIGTIRDPSQWWRNKFLFLENVGVLLGVLVHILGIATTVSLIQNMCLPMKAS